MRAPLMFLAAISLFTATTLSQTNSLSSLPADNTVAEQTALKSMAAFSASPVHSIHLAGVANATAGSSAKSGSFDFTLNQTGEGTFRVDVGTLSRTETSSGFAEAPACTWSGIDGVQHAAADHNCMLSVNWILPMLGVEAHLTGLVADLDTPADSQATTLSLTRKPVKGSPGTQELVSRLSRVTMQLDPVTSQPLSMSFATHPDSDASINIPVEVKYSDYRQVSGAVIAFHIERFLNHTKILELQADTAEVLR
jgi:hypothetical protein